VSSGRVRVERQAGIGRAILSRPDKRNALDRAMADELFAALGELEADPAIRVILIRGEGVDFCSGADLEALAEMMDAPGDVHREDAEALGRVFLAMRAIVKPIVAAVHGRYLVRHRACARGSEIRFSRGARRLRAGDGDGDSSACGG